MAVTDRRWILFGYDCGACKEEHRFKTSWPGYLLDTKDNNIIEHIFKDFQREFIQEHQKYFITKIEFDKKRLIVTKEQIALYPKLVDWYYYWKSVYEKESKDIATFVNAEIK